MTVVASSGDYGVGDAITTYYCDDSDKFQPHFPASCPYVTAVGATRGLKQEISASIKDQWATGSGFSMYFDRPEYQKDAADAYLTDDVKAMYPDKWNIST